MRVSIQSGLDVDSFFPPFHSVSATGMYGVCSHYLESVNNHHNHVQARLMSITGRAFWTDI